MFEIADLPVVNATLNGTSAILLFVGFLYIRRGRVSEHKACMVAAFSTSILFLACYLVYHFFHGSTPFTGQGWTRTVYFTILITHTVLATVVVPLVLVTLRRAFKEKFDRHATLARWTLPIWMYVSVTGVAVYWMLYQWKPA